jgi:hypothetical protein
MAPTQYLGTIDLSGVQFHDKHMQAVFYLAYMDYVAYQQDQHGRNDHLLLLFEHDFSPQVSDGVVRWFKLALLSSQRPAQVLTQRRRRDPLSSLSRSHQVRTATRASK